MTTATIAGHTVTHARVHLPAWGIPWAEIGLEEETTLRGAVKLTIADLDLVGTVMSGGPGPKGRSRFRIACGAGAWGTTLPAKGYANDAGVKASTVLGDAAREAGETLDEASLPATKLGPAFARESGVAARVLEQCFPAGWYVGADGITRIGSRPPATLTATVDVLSVNLACGTVELAAEAIAAIVPGITVEGIEAVDVMHELAPGSLRSTLWGKGIAPTTRRLAALRRLTEQLDPRRRFRGIYEYRVVLQQGERVTLQPIRVSIGMPTLQRVFVRPGVSGARSDLALGSRVVVSFLDADPSRPIVLCFEDAEGTGFLPMQTDIDATAALNLGSTAAETTIAGGTLGIARQTDPVVAGPFAGTITVGSLRARCG